MLFPPRKTWEYAAIIFAVLSLFVYQHSPAAPAWFRAVNVTQNLEIARLERRIARLEMIARHTGYDWEAPDEDKAKDVFIFSEPPASNPPK